MHNKVLPEFQEFLLSRRLVQEKHISFYAHWVSKFLFFSNKNQNLTDELKIEAFMNELKNQDKINDWQVRQADDAVRLYIGNFLAVKSSTSTSKSPVHDKKHSDVSQVLSDMKEAIRIRHYSYKTEKTYIYWVRNFFYYLIQIRKKNINESVVESEDVRDYLSYLALQKKVSASTQNQAFNSILFLFRNVLKADLKDLKNTVRAKRGQRLPVVLSLDEVKALFQHLSGRSLLMVQMLYGAGLRLMELASLRVKDIDFNSNILFIRSGKGDKDRSTILPDMVIEALQKHLENVKALHNKDLEAGYGEVFLPDALERKYPNAAKEWGWQYVFPASQLIVDLADGKTRRYHIHEKVIQKTVKEAIRKSGIVKHASVHTLRHSFATHLLMSGVNIREIQTLMGHKNVETTMIYTHVIRDITQAPQSPLDSLYRQK